MSIIELFILAVGLSMDAFAVSVCKGLSVEKVRPRHGIIVGAWFGGFQMLMPFIGYLLGSGFKSLIESFDHWIAFGLLLLIGGNMIREAIFDDDDDDVNDSFTFKTMFVLAIATSIDALASGIAVSFLQIFQMLLAAIFIGVTTFSFSFAGIFVGNKFGEKYKSKAEISGGIILILLGTKILLEHLGLLAFIGL